MKPEINLSVPTPCHEKWESFQPTAQGGFCSSCNKVVIDFTKMTDLEVVYYLANHSGPTCGRFRKNQLKAYEPLPPLHVKPSFRLLKAAFASLALMTTGFAAHAQMVVSKPLIAQPSSESGAARVSTKPQLYSGVVISFDDGLPVPGTNVHLKGSTESAVTDADGNFQFPKPLRDGDVLIFSFIGFLTQEVTIGPETPNTLRIAFTSAVATLGEVVMMGAVQVDERYPYRAKVSWREKINSWLSRK